MSELLVALLSQPLWVFMCVLARLTPALMMVPPTRTAAVPMRFRAMIAVGIAALVTPMVYATAETIPADILNISIGLAAEAIVGLLLGSIMLLALTALQLAGQAVGHLAGLDLATAIDPSSEESIPVISNMLGLLAIAILVMLGGHRQMLECCLDSFQTYPAGMASFQEVWLDEYMGILQHTFVIGIRAAAPLATALLITNLVTALLARTLPQLNILAIGFNLNALALLMLVFMSVGAIGWIFQVEFSSWIDACRRVVATL